MGAIVAVRKNLKRCNTLSRHVCTAIPLSVTICVQFFQANRYKYELFITATTSNRPKGSFSQPDFVDLLQSEDPSSHSVPLRTLH